MRVSVELPDPPRLEPLLESLSHQYQEVMQSLLKLQAESQREDRYAPILQAMQSQQDSLVSAFQHMMGMMQQGRADDQQRFQTIIRDEVAAPQQQASDALLSAIRGMKRSLSSLPDNLGEVMDSQLKSRQKTLMQQAPASTPNRQSSSASVVKKLDQMEAALLQGLKGSRNRTFGSNY
jgi:hypothetical protein